MAIRHLSRQGYNIVSVSSWSDIVFSLKSGDDNKSIMANYLFIIDIGMQE